MHRVFSTNKGLIRRIRFSPSRLGSGPESYQILVLFNEGEFGIWDIAHGNRVSISNYIKSRDLKALDIDWLSDNSPIVATSDGSLRVLDRALSLSNSPIFHANLRTPISTPHLLPTLYALQLKAILQHYISASSFLYDVNVDDKKLPVSIFVFFSIIRNERNHLSSILWTKIF